jgi:hypothetical protein
VKLALRRVVTGNASVLGLQLVQQARSRGFLGTNTAVLRALHCNARRRGHSKAREVLQPHTADRTALCMRFALRCHERVVGLEDCQVLEEIFIRCLHVITTKRRWRTQVLEVVDANATDFRHLTRHFLQVHSQKQQPHALGFRGPGDAETGFALETRSQPVHEPRCDFTRHRLQRHIRAAAFQQLLRLLFGQLGLLCSHARPHVRCHWAVAVKPQPH